MALDTSYKKFQRRTLEQDLSAFLPAAPHLPDFSNLPTAKQVGFSVNSSLMELVTRPPVCGKEILPFGAAQLAAFRLREGAIPPSVRNVVLGRSQIVVPPQVELQNGSEPSASATKAFGEPARPAVFGDTKSPAESKPSFGDSRPLFGAFSSSSSAVSTGSVSVSLPRATPTPRTETFTSDSRRAQDTFSRSSHDDSKAAKRKRAPLASDEDDLPPVKSSAVDEKRRKKDKPSTPYSQHSKDKDKDKDKDKSRRQPDSSELSLFSY